MHRTWLASTVCILVVLFTMPPSLVVAAPVVPGFEVADYVSGISSPMMLSFALDGTLFVGHQNTEDTGGRPYRVSPGGGSFSTYGESDLHDPDAVLFDGVGLFAPAGSLLAGGSADPAGHGSVVAILPDQSITSVFGISETFSNPNFLMFDSTSRLILSDVLVGNVFASAGSDPALLFNDPAIPVNVALGADSHLYVGSQDGSIKIWTSDGVLFDGAFVSGLSNGFDTGVPLAFGPGGTWGTDLYAIGDGGLYRIAGDGGLTLMGTGFSGRPTDLAFGPDGGLYVSVLDEDKILRISPVPEPTTLLMGIVGAVLVCMAGWRRLAY